MELFHQGAHKHPAITYQHNLHMDAEQHRQDYTHKQGEVLES